MPHRNLLQLWNPLKVRRNNVVGISSAANKDVRESVRLDVVIGDGAYESVGLSVYVMLRLSVDDNADVHACLSENISLGILMVVN